MLSRNLLGSFRSWPQTFLMHISDSVIPFNSSLQLLNHSGMRLSFMERNDFTIPISQSFTICMFPKKTKHSTSPPNLSLYLPTKVLSFEVHLNTDSQNYGMNMIAPEKCYLFPQSPFLVIKPPTFNRNYLCSCFISATPCYRFHG